MRLFKWEKQGKFTNRRREVAYRREMHSLSCPAQLDCSGSNTIFISLVYLLSPPAQIFCTGELVTILLKIRCWNLLLICSLMFLTVWQLFLMQSETLMSSFSHVSVLKTVCRTCLHFPFQLQWKQTVALYRKCLLVLPGGRTCNSPITGGDLLHLSS